MEQRIKKRGLSDVVTTVLIILLVLAAVAIIWSYLQGALVSSGSQITGQCLTLDLAPTACVWNSTGTNVSVRYGRDAGAANLVGVKLVLTGADGLTTVINATKIPNALESFSANFSAVTRQPLQFTVAGTIVTEAGDQKLCSTAAPIPCTAGSSFA